MPWSLDVTRERNIASRIAFVGRTEARRSRSQCVGPGIGDLGGGVQQHTLVERRSLWDRVVRQPSGRPPRPAGQPRHSCGCESRPAGGSTPRILWVDDFASRKRVTNLRADGVGPEIPRRSGCRSGSGLGLRPGGNSSPPGKKV